jgi:ubiquinone/menaquinone biosynthesis C-methylase UbiE
MIGRSVVVLASLVAAAPSADPTLAGLSPPERRMLDPLRERSLRPEALLDSLGLRGDEVVADVGAGPGFFTLRLARRLPHGRVIATDIDAPALAVLDQRAAAAALHNIETRHVAADDPGLPANSVDVAFVAQVDQYVPERTRYFVALRRALRPHGRLVLVNMARFHEPDRAAALEAGFQSTPAVAGPPGYFVMICEK